MAAVDFSKEVLPVLQRACLECHGTEIAKSGLRLHDKANALKGGEHGAVIIAGKPDASELLRRVSLPRSDKESMPRRGTSLNAPEIAALHQWISEGAVWPEGVVAAKHWAYVPPVRPTVPGDPSKTTAIDAFITEKLTKSGLHPSPEAPAHVLVRRLYFDLTGLPPSPSDIAPYLNSELRIPHSALESLVDRLLQSEEFGVKWARHWLDLARYADSHGFQRDDLRDVWAYRDWVVKALNANMPFDQFTIEQVAGDLLPNATQDQIVATGFHRCTPTNVEAGTEPEESRINQVIDRVNTTGAVWLGSTLECAQCHNHKYDPFTQHDYYGLLAYFNNTEQEADRSNPKVPGSIRFLGPMMPLAGSQDAERVQLTQAIAAMDQKLGAATKGGDEEFHAWLAKLRDESGDTLREHLLEVTEFVSDGGAEHAEQPDGSVLLKGKAPDRDTYHITTKAGIKSITAIKLEALTDGSLPGKGPGRGDAKRPNFVLNSFIAKVRQADANDDAGQPVKFARASADFSQKNFDPAGAIDNDEKSAWAINPSFHEPHWAVFALDQPLDVGAEKEFVFDLVQSFGGARTLGRVRLSAITGNLSAKTLPAPITALLQKSQDKLSAADLASLRVHFDTEQPGLMAMQREKQRLEKQLSALPEPTSLVMKELPQPRMSTLFKRGEYTQPGERITAATPGVLPATAKGPPNRLTLAKWLVSRENPLTARVAVNRLWAEIFGQGIVTTVEDFGIKGAPPSHPELLEWLAVEFMEKGWSVKQILREMVLSRAYRQSSEFGFRASDLKGGVAATPTSLDPTNSLLWRGPRLRLDAEAIRDNALAIAGLLSLQKGGPSIRPPQPDGLWHKVGGQQYDYKVSPGEQQHRRGLYVVLKRGAPYPSFTNFDASARMACVVRRSRSNTPLQALTLLNDPVYVEAARSFAKRMATEPQATAAEARVRHGFKVALAREPAAEELAVLMQLYQSKSAAGELPALEAVATALLSLDETITKG